MNSTQQRSMKCFRIPESEECHFRLKFGQGKAAFGGKSSLAEYIFNSKHPEALLPSVQSQEHPAQLCTL